MLINIIAQQEQHCINGLEVEPDQRVSSLFREISRRLNIENVERIRLIYCGRLLKNDHLLSEYNISDGSSVHMVIRSAEASHGSAEQPSGQNSNVHTIRTHTIGSGMQSILGAFVDAISQRLNSEPGEADATIVTHSNVNPFTESSFSVFRHSFPLNTNSGSNNTQREATAPSQPPVPEPQLQTSVQITDLSAEGGTRSSPQAHTNTITTPTEVPVAGVYLHVHCNLAEVDLLPERLGRVMQQMNRGSESHTPNINIQVHRTPSAHQSDHPQEEQDPRPDEVPSFLKIFLYFFAENISFTDIFGILNRNLSFFIRKREGLRQKLNDHLTRYYPNIDNLNPYEENRSRLKKISDFEGEFVFSNLMKLESVREMLAEFTSTGSQRELITSELKNVLKYYFYKLLTIIQSVEPTDDEQWASSLFHIVIHLKDAIFKRAQHQWFHDNVEPSVVLHKIYDIIIQQTFDSSEITENTQLNIVELEMLVTQLLNIVSPLLEAQRNANEDNNEIFTQWRNVIENEEAISDTELADLVIQALNEQEDTPLAQFKQTLEQWETLGGLTDDSVNTIELSIRHLPILEAQSNIPSYNVNEDPSPKPETHYPFWSEYWNEHL
ncbi:unnamed protein product [Phytomonas sp. Hart1]|nr:unnamed protein product [Phytomonas sp. Hart1]|eukprot:CCW66819.1 unnamed protein product [Phytomonas sp. isolate Hart1]